MRLSVSPAATGSLPRRRLHGWPQRAARRRRLQPVDTKSFEDLTERLPEYLAVTHPEWGALSVDDFRATWVTRASECFCGAAGTCSLILGRLLSPYVLELSFRGDALPRALRLRTSAPGRDPFGGVGAEDPVRKIAAGRVRGVRWGDDVRIEFLDPRPAGFTEASDGWIQSEQGFRVRVHLRDGLLYEGAERALRFEVERLVTPQPTLSFTGAAPVLISEGSPAQFRDDKASTAVIRRLRHALAWAGTTLLPPPQPSTTEWPSD